MMVTLDGFYEGPNREIDWHVVDDEFNTFAHALLARVDTLMFGRVTYQLMADFWPSKMALETDPVTAKFMNGLKKIVFSKTLKQVKWENTRLVNSDPVEFVTNLKNQPGKDLAIFGSSDLAIPLVQSNLIDEYWMLVNPIVLGNGKSLFKGLNERFNLKLVKTQIFHSGLVALIYEPAR
jgi:dihydrofolate reductase